jgi:hypothetical protein
MQPQYAKPPVRDQVSSRNKLAAPTPKRRGRKSVDINWPVAVADGRIALGIIDKVDGAFVAVDGAGAVVDSFEDLRSAVRAFPDVSSAANPQPSPKSTDPNFLAARRASNRGSN